MSKQRISNSLHVLGYGHLDRVGENKELIDGKKWDRYYFTYAHPLGLVSLTHWDTHNDIALSMVTVVNGIQHRRYIDKMSSNPSDRKLCAIARKFLEEKSQ